MVCRFTHVTPLIDQAQDNMPPKRSARGGERAKSYKLAPKPGRCRRAKMREELALDNSTLDGGFDETGPNFGLNDAQSKKKRRRGEKKRAKRAEQETYYLVVDGECDKDYPLKGNSCGGAQNNMIMEGALKAAKKAWAQRKRQLMTEVVIEHESTGTRYTFDPRHWCSANGQRKFSRNTNTISPLRVSTRRQDKEMKKKHTSTGLTPRLRKLEVLSVDLSDAARLRNST